MDEVFGKSKVVRFKSQQPESAVFAVTGGTSRRMTLAPRRARRIDIDAEYGTGPAGARLGRDHVVQP
jgi:hypothetical protein